MVEGLELRSVYTSISLHSLDCALNSTLGFLLYMFWWMQRTMEVGAGAGASKAWFM